MNKIYLDKLLEFTHSTYLNYYAQYNKQFELNDEITKIKQNTSLNEKGAFLKYSFVDLSSLISSIEHDEAVLIYPICFNIEENQEWFNLLNSLLLILNEDYIKESNIAKKKMLQMADKMYKKHLTIGKSLNAENYTKISDLTNLNLIILNNTDNHLSVSRYAKANINKWVICYKFLNYYFPVWNFEKKYFDSDSTFIKYLQSITDKDDSNIINNNLIETDNHDDELEESDNKQEKLCNKNSSGVKINDEKILIKDKIKNNDGYEEFVTNENYALYNSEAVDTKNMQKHKVKKSIEANINVIGEKRKGKPNKNIFVTLEQKDVKMENLPNNELIKINNSSEKIIIKNKLTNVNMDNQADSSVFKKTEIIDKNKISQIISNIKSTTKLEQIQTFALELGLNIVSGSTKDGKPKNKTKNEIIDEIKKLE